MPGNWAGSTRKDRLPPDWGRRRLHVLRRDNYRCQITDEMGRKCNAPASDVDHIERGDDHSLTNLRAACRPCHLKKSSAEGVAAQPRRTRAAEPHPSTRRR